VEIFITYHAFLKENNILKKSCILTYGMNVMGDDNNKKGIHAELDAINKLKPLKNKRMQNVNLLVIRISKSKILLNSKPCANCINVMKKLPQKKGYNIKNVYYSDDNGKIIKSSINKLENDELHYTRYYSSIGL
jgi:cytidine deaminase